MAMQRRGLTRRTVVTEDTPTTPVIYWWFTPSSRANSGVDVKYLIKLHQDRVLSCDCPGWQYSKTEPKACRHTAEAERSRDRILELLRSGSPLPVSRNQRGLLIAAPGNFVDAPDEVIEAAVAVAAAPPPPPRKKRRVVTPNGTILVDVAETSEEKSIYDRKIEL